MSKTQILDLSFFNEVYFVDGALETGKITCVKDGVEKSANWPSWAIHNKPGYQIDRAYDLISTGKVRCIDETNYRAMVKIKTLANGIKVAVK